VAEEWIGLAAVLGPVLLIALFFWLRFKSRRDMQDTIRVALDKGQDLSPELIDRLGHPKEPKDKDLRLAVIWLAIAIGLALIGVAVGEAEAIRGTLAGAAFPLMIGIAYLVMHKFTNRD